MSPGKLVRLGPTIGIVGGTGREGRALARRWALDGYPVVIGSRDAARAQRAAANVREAVPRGRVRGEDNASAAGSADVVVLTIPFAAQALLLPPLAPLVRGKVVIDATVPLHPEDPARPAPPPEGSALARAARLLGPDARLVGAFHTVSHLALAGEGPLEEDAFVCGDDPGAKEVAMALARSAGLRPLDAGPLQAAETLERLTPLLIGLGRRYRKQALGIRVTGL